MEETLEKREITTIEELQNDIEHIKESLLWAKAYNRNLVPWLEDCINSKTKILKEWIEKEGVDNE